MIIAIVVLAIAGLWFVLQCSSRLIEVLAINDESVQKARGWLALTFVILIAILVLGIIELTRGNL